jgi:DNA/RNA-binding domain of Phe-tRNA-synthetase-like protein
VKDNAIVFGYHPRVIERFPTVRAGVVWARGVDNRTPNAALAAAFRAEQTAGRTRLADTPLAELPSIAAWRRTFSAFGVSPTKHRNAAEALLRRLTKQGDLPEINPLVDLGNLASIRHGLPVLVVDLARVTGQVTVVEATGHERFADLGGTDAEHPEPGEIVFVDDAGETVARRWCWRQSTGSAAGPDTSEALIVVEAQHSGGETDVAAAVSTLTLLLSEHMPVATLVTALLGPESPTFSPPVGPEAPARF